MFGDPSLAWCFGGCSEVPVGSWPEPIRADPVIGQPPTTKSQVPRLSQWIPRRWRHNPKNMGQKGGVGYGGTPTVAICCAALQSWWVGPIFELARVVRQFGRHGQRGCPARAVNDHSANKLARFALLTAFIARNKPAIRSLNALNREAAPPVKSLIS